MKIPTDIEYPLYNGKVILKFNEEDHIYTVDGKKVESVTGITGNLDKPALIGWALKVTLAWLETQLPVGTVIDEVNLPAILKEAKGIRFKTVGKAANLGTIIHGVIEAYIKASINKTPLLKAPVNELIVNGLDAYKNWEAENNVEYLHSEKKIYSVKYHYAGTVDLLANVNNKLCLVDFKTGSGPWHEHALQTAAYAQAVEEELECEIQERIIIKLDKDTGKMYQYHCQNDKDIDAFIGLIPVHLRLKEEVLNSSPKKIWNYGN